MDHSTLTNLEDKLNRYKVDELVYPDRPVNVCITEGRTFADHVENDIKSFMKLKIDAVDLATQIRDAATALEIAQILWKKQLTLSSAEEKIWEDNEEGAYDMRDGTLDILDYFFELTDNRDKSALIAEIRKGTGNADMVMDLISINDVVEHYSEELSEKINFGEEDQAGLKYMVDLISSAFSSAYADKQKVNTARQQRDRAAMYLEDLLKKSRKVVKIIWRGNSAEQKKYRSEYRRRKYLKSLNRGDEK